MGILKSYRIVASAALVAMGSVAFAQNTTIMDQTQTQFQANSAVNETWQPSLVTDGAYDRVPHVAKPLQWQNVREADIMWKKRVWREIDTRERQNQAFRYPGDDYTGGGFFIEIILDAVKKGKIKAYSNMDDRFTNALTLAQIEELLIGKPDTTMVIDPISGEEVMKISRREFNPDVVTKYRIKEDWIFDRNIGRMQARIIGVAPILDIYNEDGSFRASQAVFWLYYPEMREMLAQYEVFNPDNDVARMTWDDYFEGRFFSSKVIKTSNPFDLSYRERGMSNMEALYESQKAAEMLFNKEHDMWVY
ncbi:gliding motility protein GldN [Polluticoccus soli]|uniref:type IX secretion system ring protein PorN/GldN n=1 Tax=Polluticoccus soli TaxID=3034150 RepID=UPI0023E1C583|nr:gliding motility protein GldN [Flavipsychrobacter sp. JY13-12]